MATGKLNIYNLGSLGVNVDKNPIELEDGELTKAQNASQDPIGGAGGLRKRQGLVKFNSVAGAGSFLGGIGVPLLKPAVRTLYAFRGDATSVGTNLGSTSINDGTSWVAMSVVAGVVGARPIGELGTSTFGDATFNGIPVITLKNRTFYAAATSAVTFQSTANPQIRIWDGTVSTILAQIPYNPDVGPSYDANNANSTDAFTTVSLLSANGAIYLATFDGAVGNVHTEATRYGRVFSLNPDDGTLTQLGPSFPVGFLPYSLAWHDGKLWVGTARHTVDTLKGRIYWFRPNSSTTWTLDNATTVDHGNCSLMSYKGLLYAGNIATSGVNAIVRQRSLAGTWSTVETGTGTAECNAYRAMVVFNGNLYVSYYDSTGPTALIRKFDGTTWSTAYTGVGSSVEKYDSFLLYNSKLYAVPSNNNGTIVRTANGSSWTAMTNVFPSIAIAGLGVINT